MVLMEDINQTAIISMLHFHFHIKMPFSELNTFKYTTAGKETMKTENIKQT